MYKLLKYFIVSFPLNLSLKMTDLPPISISMLNDLESLVRRVEFGSSLLTHNVTRTSGNVHKTS